MEKYLLYRITSKVNQKPRIGNFSKIECLENLLKVFSSYKVICVADNCDLETIEILKSKNFLKLIITSLGNAGSFRYLITEAIFGLNSDDIVYFVEDDYLHLPGSAKILEEGLEYFDYVSLYDHPDKYAGYIHKNIFVRDQLLSETTKILKANYSIWRTTNSTTMTFATYVEVMRQDKLIWNLFTSRYKVPMDFYIWISLTMPNFIFKKIPLNKKMLIILASIHRIIFSRKRTLGIPLESKSAHLELGMLPDNFIEFKNIYE